MNPKPLFRDRMFWQETSAQHCSTLNGERTYVETLNPQP